MLERKNVKRIGSMPTESNHRAHKSSGVVPKGPNTVEHQGSQCRPTILCDSLRVERGEELAGDEGEAESSRN